MKAVRSASTEMATSISASVKPAEMPGYFCERKGGESICLVLSNATKLSTTPDGVAEGAGQLTLAMATVAVLPPAVAGKVTVNL